MERAQMASWFRPQEFAQPTAMQTSTAAAFIPRASAPEDGGKVGANSKPVALTGTGPESAYATARAGAADSHSQRVGANEHPAQEPANHASGNGAGSRSGAGIGDAIDAKRMRQLVASSSDTRLHEPTTTSPLSRVTAIAIGRTQCPTGSAAMTADANIAAPVHDAIELTHTMASAPAENNGDTPSQLESIQRAAQTAAAVKSALHRVARDAKSNPLAASESSSMPWRLHVEAGATGQVAWIAMRQTEPQWQATVLAITTELQRALADQGKVLVTVICNGQSAWQSGKFAPWVSAGNGLPSFNQLFEEQQWQSTQLAVRQQPA
jgi:hypothetical protein